MIEYCVKHAEKQRDRTFDGRFNSIARVPSSGRKLKVVYAMKGKDIKIITAFWLD